VEIFHLECELFSIKIINPTATANNPTIAWVGTTDQEAATPQKAKSETNGVTIMEYETGNQLLYKATSGNFSTIVTDVPTASKTTNFNFVLCQDADGNNYSVVTIGTQTWMAENLKTTKYRNGNLLLIGSYKDISLELTPKYQWAGKYGSLYTWYAATDSRNIAPTGWHIPTDAEWTTLEHYVAAHVGSSSNNAVALAAATYDWTFGSGSPYSYGEIGFNRTRNNSTGFSALPDRYFTSNPAGYWWSSTQYDAVTARSRILKCYNNYVDNGNYDKTSGFSVRCVRD